MAHIRFKLADNVELECDAAEEFLKAEVSSLMKLLLDAHTQLPAAVKTTSASTGNGHAKVVNGKGGNQPPIGDVQGTTETIAAKLGVKDSSDLAIAAAARLAFVEGKTSFSRNEILGEMETAKAYFKEHHKNNLTRTLRNLVKDGVLNGIAADTFAFSANARTDIDGRIRA